MKAGARAVGVAESYRDPPATGPAATSTVAAVVVRPDRVVDGFAFGRWTVGGTDATETAIDLVDDLDREDLQVLLLAGIAPAWFNLLDLRALQAAVGLPVISVSFEASPGLEPALRTNFDGAALETRLRVYRDQPERARQVLNGESVFVRAVGVEGARARSIVAALTPEGGRPEPLRVARLAARAADRLRAD